MEKIIAGRHFKVEPEIKEFIIDQLTEIEQEYDKLTSARVVLDKQRERYHAEVIIHGKNLEIEAEAKATDLRACVDQALEKADRQLRKHLDRIQNHHHTPVSSLERRAENELLAEGEEEEEYLQVAE